MKLWLIAAAAAVGGLTACTAQAQYAPPPMPNWNGHGFWDGAPASPRDRIDYLEHRIDSDYAARRIDGREAYRAKGELRQLRDQIRGMHYDNGPLTVHQADFVQKRLDQISREVHWEARSY